MFTTRIFIPFFFFFCLRPRVFVRFFCRCWWPISVHAYACVRSGQSVKLGLAWSHDITGLRGLLLLLLLLLFLSPHKLLQSLLQVSGSVRFLLHYILHWKPAWKQDSLGEFWTCFSWGEFVSVSSLYVGECTFVKAWWRQKKKNNIHWRFYVLIFSFSYMTSVSSLEFQVSFICMCVNETEIEAGVYTVGDCGLRPVRRRCCVQPQCDLVLVVCLAMKVIFCLCLQVRYTEVNESKSKIIYLYIYINLTVICTHRHRPDDASSNWVL